MYTLIGNPKNRSFRVVWMLEELQQPYTIEPAQPQSELARQHNPAGKVPVLLDGDQPVIDSVAIIQYLADKHASCTHSAGTLARAQQDSLTQFALDDMDAILWTAAKHDFILPEALRLEGVRKACLWDFARSMESLGARLGEWPYLCGDQLTVPDIIVTHCAGWAMRAKFPLPDDAAFKEYLARVEARDAYRKAAEIRAAA